MPSFKLVLLSLLVAHYLVPIRNREGSETIFAPIILRQAVAQALISYVLVARWELWYLPIVVLCIHVVASAFTRDREEERQLTALALIEGGSILLLVVLAYAVMRWGQADGSPWWSQFEQVYALVLLQIVGVMSTVVFGSKVVEAAVQPLQTQLEAWREVLAVEGKSRSIQGLRAGGRMIGMLERALIYVFIMLDQPAALGFLIAAKSVFRIGEISEKGNRMEAEYILIGTLWSFLIGIITASAARWLLLAG